MAASASAIVLLCSWTPKPSQPVIRSIGVIAALGDTCMFEHVTASPFEWITPPKASFLEISDWNLDDDIVRAITKQLGPRYRIQPIAIEHQAFDTWDFDSLARHIRELPVPEKPVDAYLVILRDWRGDEIGNSDHQVAGLGVYRRDMRDGGKRLGVFASYRLVLADPDTGHVIASRPALLPNSRLPWVPAGPGAWPRTQNDLTDWQRSELQGDFKKLLSVTLPRVLQQLVAGSQT